jgi:hypothetical protein
MMKMKNTEPPKQALFGLIHVAAILAATATGALSVLALLPPERGMGAQRGPAARPAAVARLGDPGSSLLHRYWLAKNGDPGGTITIWLADPSAASSAHVSIEYFPADGLPVITQTQVDPNGRLVRSARPPGGKETNVMVVSNRPIRAVSCPQGTAPEDIGKCAAAVGVGSRLATPGTRPIAEGPRPSLGKNVGRMPPVSLQGVTDKTLLSILSKGSRRPAGANTGACPKPGAVPKKF